MNKVKLDAATQKKLKKELLYYLDEIAPGRKTNKNYAASALYLLNQDVGCSLADVIGGKISLTECKRLLGEYCVNKGQCNSVGNAYLYFRSVSYLKEFIDNRYGSLEHFCTENATTKTDK